MNCTRNRGLFWILSALCLAALPLSAQSGRLPQGPIVTPAAPQLSPFPGPSVNLSPSQQAAYRTILATLDELIMGGTKSSLVYDTYGTVRKAMQDGKLLFVVDTKNASKSLLNAVYFSPNKQGPSYVVASPALFDAQAQNPSLVLSLIVNALTFAETYFTKGQQFLDNYEEPVQSFKYSMDAIYVQALFVRDYLVPKYSKVSDYERFLVDSLGYDNLASVSMFVIGVDQEIVYGIDQLGSDLAAGNLKADGYIAKLTGLMDKLDSTLKQAADLEKSPLDPSNNDEKDLRERTRYIATVSGLTMLKYGVSLVNAHLARYLSGQKSTAQAALEQFNKRLASLATSLEQSIAGVTQYRAKYLARLSLSL